VELLLLLLPLVVFCKVLLAFAPRNLNLLDLVIVKLPVGQVMLLAFKSENPGA